MNAEDRHVIVCDSGTGFVKCGYAGSESPAFTFSSLVGRPSLRAMSASDDAEAHTLTVGDEASRCRSMLKVNYPMEKGTVRNWDDMINVWDYTFGSQKMNIDPTDCKILLTEPPLNAPRNRERTIEVMFEHYGFDRVYIGVQGVLTLYAQGRYTGVVVDSGDGVTYICPVFGGCEQAHATRRFDVAGRDITRHLMKLLLHRGYVFNESVDFETVRQMKEKLCYVANDVREEHRLAVETTCLVETYTLPDGRPIRLGTERYEAPEILFQPRLIGMEAQGIAELVFRTIQCVDSSMRANLYRNIILSGGTTMFPGLPSRLDTEMRALYVERILQGDAKRLTGSEIKVRTLPNRMDAVFIGGSMLAYAARNYPNFWISREDYQEKGLKVLDELPQKYSSLSLYLLRHCPTSAYCLDTSTRSMDTSTRSMDTSTRSMDTSTRSMDTSSRSINVREV